MAQSDKGFQTERSKPISAMVTAASPQKATHRDGGQIAACFQTHCAVVKGKARATRRHTPGAPNRWRLPQGPPGLADMAAQQALAQQLCTLYTAYCMLQGVAIVAMLVRWMQYIGFQRRLRIIGATFALALPVRREAGLHACTQSVQSRVACRPPRGCPK